MINCTSQSMKMQRKKGKKKGEIRGTQNDDRSSSGWLTGQPITSRTECNRLRVQRHVHTALLSAGWTVFRSEFRLETATVAVQFPVNRRVHIIVDVADKPAVFSASSSEHGAIFLSVTQLELRRPTVVAIIVYCGTAMCRARLATIIAVINT